MGIGIVYSVGIFSGGPFWLFTSSILAALLLGSRAALVTIALNVIILILYYQFIVIHNDDIIYFKTFLRALLALVSFLLLNIVTAISSSVLVRQLEAITKRESKLVDKMKTEQLELVKAKDSLNYEIEVRKKIERYLRESEEKYRYMTKQINDVIWSMDLEMNYTYLSPVASRVHGWDESELNVLSVYDFLTPQSLQKAISEIGEQIRLSEKSGDYNSKSVIELEMYKKDKTTFWTEVTSSFIIGDDGKPSGIMGVTRDITERKKIEVERELMHQKLERSEKMEALGLLAGGVAHDLNNVLSGIVSYPDLLLLDLDESSHLKEPIETIRDSGLKAAAIVQDLLSLARRSVANMMVIDINSIIDDFFQSPEYIDITNNHSHVKIKKTLPQQKLNIKGSQIHLKKMLLNLVLNAAEAQPDGGIVDVEVASRYLDIQLAGYDSVEPGEYIVLSVKDQGSGIDDEDIVHIFEPFYTKKIMGRSGTGLGMAIVWGTVQDHNGYIDISSSNKTGTVIEIYFPLCRDIPSDEVEIVDIKDFSGNGESILVVDDIEEQRKISRALLERLGYIVHTAASGEEAIKIIDQLDPKLVILDMIMDPGIDGLETFMVLKEIKPHIKAIIASGFSETDRVKEALRLGAGAYLKKPYYLENLGIAVYKEIHRT